METIVVGIDGSEPSQRALEWAAAEARVRQARLRVVHSWFDPFTTAYFAAPALYERDAVVGSVSNQVVHRAPCPVVVIR